MKTMWKKAAAFLLQLSYLSHHVSALHRGQLFLYGTLNGDETLQEGDDETSEVMTLRKPMRFFDTSFNKLYVATNGIISPSVLPMEKQYVDDGFPTEFPVIAPFLADLDTSNGRGAIYYRQTESPGVLNRIASEVQKGFPDIQFTPTHAIIATWENVGAYKEVPHTSESSQKVNTFQAVVAYDEENTYALFLYPEDGLQFFGTRPKEMFNVEIELPARVGFTRGEIPYFFISRTEGPFFSLTSNEQSVKDLYQTGNTGVPGVWLFHIGNAYAFNNVIPASTSGRLSAAVATNQAFQTTPEYPAGDDEMDKSFNDEEEYNFDPDFTDVTEAPQPGPDESHLSGQKEPDSSPSPHVPYEEDVTLSPDTHIDQTIPTDVSSEDVIESKDNLLEAYPSHPQGQVVNVEENVTFDSEAIPYSTGNEETCDRFQQTCSQNAFCADYPSGYCCHCQVGFYGNGRHCLPDGAPQRMNGKVTGTVSVGSTPVGLDNIDLHAYIVVSDGRAYTAISEVPERLGWALMPVTPIGGLFGWLFALKLPNSHNGFNITGAEFTRHADVTFYPGNQRLAIVQTARGLDSQNYLNIETHLEGSVPFIPPGASIQIEPFSETYQYYPSLITSTSVREFTIMSAQSGAEKFTFQLRQNISYSDCRHTPRAGAETLELSVERIFAMYVKEERILRYAITNKIGRVGDYVPVPVQTNPCYIGNHDCDTTAQCIPGEGQHFTCVCATGYTGDGRNCYDVDECAEDQSSCGSYAHCVNLPGSHSCQCQSGYEYRHDRRTCIDIDECQRNPCHAHASCANTVGSFYCQCQHGFHGDGFQCHRQDIGEEGSKTLCEYHRDIVQTGIDDGIVSVLGDFLPQCDDEGGYRSQQCHGSRGYCWCVDSSGKERAGTRTWPGIAPIDCYAQARPKTQCEQHRDSTRYGADGVPVLGAYIPECDEEGQYRPKQCHFSTRYCWCVDSRGQERAGTRTPPGTPHVNCDAPVHPERQKTHCEHHRDAVPAGEDELPVVEAFVPQCDEDGGYRSQQCHGSTGYCWCVDSSGQERAGTRTAPGTPHVNCDAPVHPERQKTQCEHHRDTVQAEEDGVPVVGAFVPQCDEEGQYRSQQCHGSTGQCWCVDSSGQERAGTRTGPGTPRVNCDAPERPKTQCEHHRDTAQARVDGVTVVGAFVPQCDEEGRYRSQQCHGSTGHCWCVDSSGQERAGTRTAPGAPRVNCDAPGRPKTQCEHHRDRIQQRLDGLSIEGAFVPQCDEEGRYRTQQCHGSTGHCWCVDSSGQERAGTRTAPGAPGVDCDAPERPKTPCEQHRDRAHRREDGVPSVGALVPQCDEEGRYRSQQCHGSTGHCWCVDSSGQERAGTRTRPGAPHVNCDAPERAKTQCEHHRDTVLARVDGVTLVGAFVPQCDEEGHYRSQQCHGSTGHCWCVDSSGQEREGTRTTPGAPRVNCDAPESPKTPCEQHRDRAHRQEDGVPSVGAFIPQCDEEGRYRSQQCHGSTGHCWCVDSSGQERAGTRTRPGAPHVDCDAPERPKTQCEHHRDTVQERVDGMTLEGAFVPQCDGEGRYRSQQCHGSTGHCWCVDSSGQERAGTRTRPGAPHVNCDAPERPKTPCEQHRDRAQRREDGLPALGAFVPQCDEEGRYRSQQCHGSTGHCWCVDSSGQERAGTHTRPGAPHVDCDAPERPKTQCEHHRDTVQERVDGMTLEGAFVPQCDEEGRYRSQQCHGSTGHCWCVDRSGQERAGTRTAPGTPRVNCDAPERPKTPCEQHRERAQRQEDGVPVVGAFVPQCDEEGHYKSQQCHGSTGHCWCVDSSGQERAGTRIRPGAPLVDCDAPERPKTPCEQHRDRAQRREDGVPVVGAFVPQCDEDGRYRSQQCHGSTGHCWCVDSSGQERAGTRTRPGAPHVDCDAPERPKTQCEHHRDTVLARVDGVTLVGAVVPQCDEEGRYRSRQCHGSTGHCWCVDSSGQERAGTRTAPGAPRVNCDAPESPKTPCEQHRDRAQRREDGVPVVGAFVPQCDEDGRYRSQQCHGSTGHCWCVDSSGQERAGTRTRPGAPHVDCDAPERPKTPCEQHRDRAQRREDGVPVVGAFVPQCDEDGRYRSQQCHGSTGHCWCVDSSGQERAGTRTRPGAPHVDCDAPERPKTPCEQHRDRAQRREDGVTIVGAFVPQCDEEGHYKSQQCHGSTGHCWCVDSSGQERAGTRTRPGAPNVDCDAPERPKSLCEQHRDRAQRREDGVPVVGAFVPQCDEEGRYRSQQCHGATGHCWCVDSSGQERAGTRTRPGAPHVDCDGPERPKTPCEQHRDRAPRQEDGVPVVGAFVPQCDEEGSYRSQQCHGSTGHCWCVDSSGQERAGTRTAPGTPHVNCDAPERPRTPCEQHRDRLQRREDGITIVGAFVPQCDEEGHYKSQQCHGSTGHCWCVDSSGQERAGTRTRPGAPNVDCDAPERPKSLCEQHRDRAQRREDGVPVVGAFVPQCDEEGRYRSQQCHGATGHCWCVDSSGQERAGTRTRPGAPHVDCDGPERPKTPCEQHRDRAPRQEDGVPVVGAFVPQCDEEGSYRSQQCHGSTGHCWCVDSSGQERAGTRTAPGTPHVNCDAPERPRTPCEQHRDRLQRREDGITIVGAFVPQCDEEGRYRSQQCHGSTGHCWCVDSSGQERAGTRTRPGAPHVDCDAPERPKTPCEQHRNRAQRREDGLPVVGAFVPQCDEQGHYRSQQCHGSTGHCWCVDSSGQEKAGTRTAPGAPHVDCDAPERPKTQCEHHRDTVKARVDGVTLVGAVVPQCDEEGRYRTRQCHGSTGYCWCVDSRGQERAGTRTAPGTPRVDCDAPERPKTPCEQHRDRTQRREDGVPAVGAFVPQCDEQGRYRSQQCHGSTGHCWCVDSSGQVKAGTRTAPGAPHIDCDAPERPKTPCEQHRDRTQRREDGVPAVGAFVPQCDEQGRYRSQQCHGSTGHCWCVDSSGQEKAGTRTAPGAPHIDCDAPERPKTPCEQHRDQARARGDGLPVVGAFVPQCDDEGGYRSQQCHGSTGYCWCVDSSGQERAGTRTAPGAPRVNCDAPVVVAPVQRPETVCERWRASLIEHYGGHPGPKHFLPRCDATGEFTPVQCYGETPYCWCVDKDGREIPGTRSQDQIEPACIPTVATPTMRPLRRPDVTPPPSGTSLLYAQGQQIGALPLNGTRMDKERSSVLLALHGSIVVGIDYDCKERKVYWTDIAGRTISRAALEPGSEPEILINTGLVSPEGLAVDIARRRMFWVDSTPDKIESARLDGSDRRVLFNTDLVNPRAIVVDSVSGMLYWTDWNREAPKIESSTVEGRNRRVLVRDGIGLPNALTIDATTRRICWADAGTKRLECIAPDGTGRHVIHSNLNYPFSMVFYSNHFYYTDWRRDGIVGVSRDSSQFTDEFLPDQRSHLYGIAVAPTSCS